MSRLLYTLGKKERMKSRKRIDALFTAGRKLQLFPFRLLYIISKQEPGEAVAFPVQAGFTASSRNFPRAVDRNRLKRLMREMYRRQKAPLGEAAFKTGNRVELFWIYTGREITDNGSIENGIAALIRKLAGELK